MHNLENAFFLHENITIPRPKEVWPPRWSESGWNCSDSNNHTLDAISRQLICKLRMSHAGQAILTLDCYKKYMKPQASQKYKELPSFFVKTLDRDSEAPWQFCCKQQILQYRNAAQRKDFCRGLPAMPEQCVLNFRGFFKTGWEAALMHLECTDSSVSLGNCKSIYEQHKFLLRRELEESAL